MELSKNDMERLRLLDRLLECDNETVNDLLDQALTVARMIKPDAETNSHVGTLEKLFKQNNYLMDRLASIENSLVDTHGPFPTMASPTDSYDISTVTIADINLDWCTDVVDTSNIVIDLNTISSDTDK